jgi:hypothetical protein
MRRLIGLLCWAAVCAAVLGGVWTLVCSARDALAAVDLPGTSHSLMSAVHEGETLEAQNQAAQERLLDKQEVVSALLDGRLSLREAGDDFRRMNAESAETGWTGRGGAACSAGASPDAAAYANLMAWVNSAARAEPRWRARAARLGAEAESLLRQPLHGL